MVVILIPAAQVKNKLSQDVKPRAGVASLVFPAGCPQTPFLRGCKAPVYPTATVFGMSPEGKREILGANLSS